MGNPSFKKDGIGVRGNRAAGLGFSAVNRATHARSQILVGQIVELKPEVIRNNPGGSYTITKLLPERAASSHIKLKVCMRPPGQCLFPPGWKVS
jgi:hypothetical protein